MKILSEDIVKTGVGKCVFCQKDFVRGVLGSFSLTMPVISKETKYVIDNFEYVNPIFGGSYRKIKGDIIYEHIFEGNETKTIEPLICFNCIKELAKLNK